ncbi:MAG TPA: RNA polymerase sigma factor [Povalibacter sp.]|nr:RNA polymerase sigma factor [Povalibacter sp.]
MAKPTWDPERAGEFSDFMRAYQDMVFATTARLAGNEAVAEDIAQEVFLKAFENFHHLRSSPTAGGWLKTVATRLTLNHLSRYRRRWQFFSEMRRDDEEDEAPEIEFAAPETLLTDIDAGRRRAMIEEVLQQLPDHQRLPLVLYHFEEMPYEDIARTLGVSLGKVKIDILRARRALARVLTGGELQATL